MANEINKRDANYVTVMTGVTDDASLDITQLRVDPTTKRLKVDQSALTAGIDAVNIANASDVEINPATEETLDSIDTNTGNLVAGTTLYNGQKNVTTAGTQVVIASSTIVKWVIVKAKATNTGNIFVGDSNVDSTTGYILTPGEAIGLDLNNLNIVYIDSAVNGEGITYIARN